MEKTKSPTQPRPSSSKFPGLKMTLKTSGSHDRQRNVQVRPRLRSLLTDNDLYERQDS